MTYFQIHYLLFWNIKKAWNCLILSLVYIELGETTGATATLKFDIGSRTLSRSWEIKVTQVECWNTGRPEAGCLQYVTGTTGRIQSFNFGQSSSSDYQHLHNQE